MPPAAFCSKETDKINREPAGGCLAGACRLVPAGARGLPLQRQRRAAQGLEASRQHKYFERKDAGGGQKTQ